MLTLSGDASHAWLERVRRGAGEIPGITSLQENDVTDVDLLAFQESKSVIESAFVYFLTGKENFATEGFAALSRLPEEIRRCRTAAKRIGTEIRIEVQGSADARGTETKNHELSENRARAVCDFLVSCGLESTLFKPLVVTPLPAIASGSKPLAEEANRRVAFHVAVQQ